MECVNIKNIGYCLLTWEGKHKFLGSDSRVVGYVDKDDKLSSNGYRSGRSKSK